MTKLAVPKVRLMEAAIRLSMLCEEIEYSDANELDAILKMEFNNAMECVTEAVDSRKAMYAELESKIEMAKAYRDKVTDAVKRYEWIKARVIETTKQVIEANPGIPFKDSFGKALKVLPNPIPKLTYGVGIETVEAAPYVKETFVRAIDTEKLKADLMAGVVVPWASLEYGTQLRGLK